MRLRGYDELSNLVRFRAFHNARMSPPLAAASVSFAESLLCLWFWRAKAPTIWTHTGDDAEPLAAVWRVFNRLCGRASWSLSTQSGPLIPP
jgi:hypothetical protein